MENETQDKIREALFKGVADKRLQAAFERYAIRHSPECDSYAGGREMRQILSETFPISR